MTFQSLNFPSHSHALTVFVIIRQESNLDLVLGGYAEDFGKHVTRSEQVFGIHKLQTTVSPLKEVSSALSCAEVQS